MYDFQLTHVALVGARMSAFHAYGYKARSDLTLCRVAPESAGVALSKLSDGELREKLQRQLPLWVHNIISDPEFPSRDKLLMPLRRFEGELKDSKNDEVVSAVLSKGFMSEYFDPFDLPRNMPVRERCAIIAHLQVWQDAYRSVERDLLDLLVDHAEELESWSEYAKHPSHVSIQ
ncbi:MAG: hypothetical protein AAGI11_13210 [Pseudomonadota bacterium]